MHNIAREATWVSKTRSTLKWYSWEDSLTAQPSRMSSERRPTKKHRVRLDIVEVVVRGRSIEVAVRFARTKVSCDTLRLYDIIHGAVDGGFQIDEIEAESSL
jgi:hypothetical protein